MINESHFRDTSTYLKTYLSKRDTKAQNELDSLLGSCKKQNGKLNDKIEEVSAFVDRIKDFFSGKTLYFNYTEERDKKSLTAEQKQEYITELQERYRIKIRNQLILYTHLFERSSDFVFKKPKAIENLQAGEREEAELREQLIKIESGLAKLTENLDQITIELKKNRKK